MMLGFGLGLQMCSDLTELCVGLLDFVRPGGKKGEGHVMAVDACAYVEFRHWGCCSLNYVHA